MSVPTQKHDVGYGRPPEHAKWKKGQCGNPRRIRKRKVKPVAAIVDEFFASERVVTENGVTRRASAFEIICLQLFNKASAGDTRALKALKEYSDFAASREPSGGMRLELIETNTKEPGANNG